MTNPKSRINELTDLLIEYNEQYYNQSKPTVSDREYDLLMIELIGLENKYPELIRNDSPTKQVGAKNKFKKFEEYKHAFEMYSIDNAFSEKNLIDFDTRIKKILGSTNEIDYLVEWKIDGLSINLHYENGKLEKAVTRGNGVVGENVIENIKLTSFYDLIKTISYKKMCEIKGEIVLNKKAFDELLNDFEEANEKYIADGSKPKQVPVNARNLASGIIRDFKSKEDLNDYFNIVKNKAKKLLSLVLYQVQTKDRDFKTQSEVIEFLHQQKLPTHSFTKTAKGIANTFQTIEEMWNKVDNEPWECDGLVVKVNDLFICDQLGFTNKFPRWAVAYKHLFATATTTIEKIFVTIGRTGKATYNAKFKPVNLLNSTIQAASLHNHEYIVEKNINIGDEVEIEKAGGIIPQIIKVTKKNSSNYFPAITNCPTCNSFLKKYEDNVDQFCENIFCKDRVTNSLIHFCSKDAMDIFFFGTKWIEYLVNSNVINKFSDIYKITSNIEMQKNIFKIYSQNMEKENKKISVDLSNWKMLPKMIEAIELSKNKNLSNLIYALGIHLVGEKKATTLAKKYKTLQNFIEQSALSNFKDQLTSIKDFGTSLVESITSFMNDKNNIEELNLLIRAGVNTIYKDNFVLTNTNTIFYEKNIVITGTFSKSRNELKLLLESLGANVYDSVTKNIDYLITGTDSGESKLKKYNQLKDKTNIKLIEKEEFEKIVNG